MAPEKPQQRPNEGGDNGNQKKEIFDRTKEALANFFKNIGILSVLRESKREQKNLISRMKREARKEQQESTSETLRSFFFGNKNESSNGLPPSPGVQREFEKSFKEITQNTEYPLNQFFSQNFPKIKIWFENMRIPFGAKSAAELIVGAMDSIISSVTFVANVSQDVVKFALRPKKEFLRTWYVWNEKDDKDTKSA